MDRILIYLLVGVCLVLIFTTANQNKRLEALESVIEQMRPAAPTGARQLEERR